MKIAVLSDIHGNKLALDSVLADAESVGAERFFVLGDLAMGGYDPNYTIEKVFALKDLEIIQGNTDKLIVDFDDEICSNLYSVNPLMASALELDIREIKDENKLLLSKLSVNKDINLFGNKILLCHGTPRKQDENLFPDTKMNIVEEMVNGTDASIILCGHTHIPCGFSLNNGKTVVNVGSVGRSMIEDKMPVYLLMIVNPDGSFSFEHRKVKYDNEKVAQIIKSRDFEKSVEFSKLYIKEQ